MKTVLVITSILFSLNSSAMKTPGTEIYTSIAGEVLDVQPLCPKGVTCIVGGTIVTVGHTIDCAAKLVSRAYEVKQIGTELHVFMNAVVKTTALGPNDAKCMSLSQQVTTLTLVNQFGDVKLHNLGAKAQLFQ